VAVCRYCGQQMKSADGCVVDDVVIEGVAYAPILYGSERGLRRVRHRCLDCDVLPGRVHHHGCDVECCPRCRGQSISCGCIWKGEEHLSEEWLEELEDRFARS
jgi:hypothetical protein